MYLSGSSSDIKVQYVSNLDKLVVFDDHCCLEQSDTRFLNIYTTIQHSPHPEITTHFQTQIYTTSFSHQLPKYVVYLLCLIDITYHN